MNKIGIIGQGYVGEAIKVIFEKYYTVDTFDINKESTCLTLEELVKKTNYIFICLPTPMNKDGSCNTQIVKTTIRNINKISNKLFLVDIIIISYYYEFKIGFCKTKVDKRKGRAKVGGNFLTNIKILKIFFNTLLIRKNLK